jgi:hypothetical protein
LAEAVLEYLTRDEYAKALADAVRGHLDKNETKAILKSATSTSKLTPEGIYRKLADKTALALKNITERDYPGLIREKAMAPPKEIIGLGLAVFGDGSEAVAAFGPK